MEDVRSCKKRGKRGLSWTLARQALAKTVALGEGGGDATDCAGLGFGAIWAGGFLPVKAARGCKTVAGKYFQETMGADLTGLVRDLKNVAI